MSSEETDAHKIEPQKHASASTLARRGAALVLLVVLGAYFHGHEMSSPLLALGLLVLGGDLLAQVTEPLGLPHITGYLFAGILLGPFGVGAASHEDVESLNLVNALALALIALSAGAELTLSLLSKGLRSLVIAVGVQVLILLPLLMAIFIALRSHIEFVAHLPLLTTIAVAMLWSVVALSRSPSATLGIIAQLKPSGPLTRYTLVLVIAFDILVLLLFSVAMQGARAMVAGGGMDLKALYEVGEALVGSIACGITLGLLIIAYLRFVGQRVLLFLIVIGYGVTVFARYADFDELLLFVTAGFIVTNLSAQGAKLLAGVEQGGSVVYVLFFANAGAHLDIPLLARLWPIALALCAARVALTGASTWIGSRIAGDEPVVRRYAWMPLVSQAGVTIGMAVTVANAFPAFGADFRALAVAVVGLNESIGPILFKTALAKAGEIPTPGA